MRDRVTCRVALLVLAAAIAAPAVAGADVDVSVNVDIGPPPTYVVPAAPALVVVPGTPVYYAPAVPYTFFVYGGRYYTVHHGHWYHRPKHGGPWVFVAPAAVPGPVLAVPAAYHKSAPGHWKRGGPPPGRGHGRGGKRGKDD
jgi:hypothetical protein